MINKDKKILLMMIIIFSFCLIDTIATLYSISLGAIEVNPIMKAALDAGEEIFIIVKNVSSILFLSFIWWLRNKIRNRLLYSLLSILIIIYSGVMMWHIYNFSLI